MTNMSAQRCKKYGKGRGTGTHHSRRDRVADPNKASEAQLKRAAHRAAGRARVKIWEEQLRGRILRVERDRNSSIVDEARPTEERKKQLTSRSPLFGVDRTPLIESFTATPPAPVSTETTDDTLALIHELDTHEEQVAALRAQPIEELELPVRPYNALKREGVNSIGELADKTEADLQDMRGIGQKSIDEQIKPRLAALDPPLSLKSDTTANA